MSTSVGLMSVRWSLIHKVKYAPVQSLSLPCLQGHSGGHNSHFPTLFILMSFAHVLLWITNKASFVAAPTTQDLNVDKGSNISDVHDFGIQDSILQMAPFFGWNEAD